LFIRIRYTPKEEEITRRGNHNNHQSLLDDGSMMGRGECWEKRTNAVTPRHFFLWIGGRGVADILLRLISAKTPRSNARFNLVATTLGEREEIRNHFGMKGKYWYERNAVSPRFHEHFSKDMAAPHPKEFHTASHPRGCSLMRLSTVLAVLCSSTEPVSATLPLGSLSFQWIMLSLARLLISFFGSTASHSDISCLFDRPDPPVDLLQELQLTRPGFLAPNASVIYLDSTSPSSRFPRAATLNGSHLTAHELGSRDRVVTAANDNLRMPRISSIDDDGMFVDSTGAKRLLRGMAVSYKAEPYLPSRHAFDPKSSFSEVDFRLFDKLNLNVIRLGVSWAAVQPNRGPNGFDHEHLRLLRGFVEECGRHGLYVLVEAHQDLFSEIFTGDGFPPWAATTDQTTSPFPVPMQGWKTAHYDSNGKVDNIAYSDAWALFHGSDAVTRAFWGLYTDFQGVQGEFARFWAKVAETFTDMDNVIGYGESSLPTAVRSHRTLWMSF